MKYLKLLSTKDLFIILFPIVGLISSFTLFGVYFEIITFAKKLFFLSNTSLIVLLIGVALFAIESFKTMSKLHSKKIIQYFLVLLPIALFILYIDQFVGGYSRQEFKFVCIIGVFYVDVLVSALVALILSFGIKSYLNAK